MGISELQIMKLRRKKQRNDNGTGRKSKQNFEFDDIYELILNDFALQILSKLKLSKVQLTILKVKNVNVSFLSSLNKVMSRVHKEMQSQALNHSLTKTVRISCEKNCPSSRRYVFTSPLTRQ